MILSESARFYCLDDQHTLEQAAVDQRYSQERMIWVFARFSEVLESGMGGSVFDYHGLHLLGDEPDQPFVEPHPDLAYALGAKSNGGGQHEVWAVRLEQGAGAHVCFEALLHQHKDVVHGFRWRDD